MKLDLYTTMVSALPFLAILISGISLFLSIKNKRTAHQARRGDLVEKIAANHAKLESLITVYLQEKDILWRRAELPENAIELRRVDEGLTSSMQRKETYREKLSDVQAAPAGHSVEERLATEKAYFAEVSEELAREQNALKKLLDAKRP
jgi:hypothetical protein